jgi:HK97 gp10 family phage protein
MTTLRSRFPEIEAELRPRLGEAVRLAAEAVEQAAKARVPVATGKLRNSIHTEMRGLDEAVVLAGDGDVFYGHMVEHGTVHSPPRPFLVPAMEESRAAAVALAVRALRTL